MIPTSTIQQQFLFLERMHPGNSAYNMPSLFHIEGALDLDALKISLRSIAERHEILRTVFEEKDGVFHPLVHDTLPLDFQLIRSEKAQSSDFSNEIENELKRPFDFEQGPLWRTRVFQVSEQEFYLLFVMQHTVIDLRSKELFSRELELLYHAHVTHKNVPELPEVCPYSEYSQWEKQFIASNRFAEMKDFWKEQLNGINQIVDLPTDYKRPAFLQPKGAAEELSFDAKTFEAIKQFCSNHQITVYLFMQVAYLTLLHRYTGKADFITGIPFTNRRNGNHKDSMGCFVNMLPIPIKFKAQDSFLDILKQMRKTMLLAHRNQEITMKSIIGATNPDRDLSYNPLFQNGFTFEPPMRLNLHGVDCEPVKVHNHGAQLDLLATLWESDSTLKGFIEYNTDLFKKETVKRLAENYKTLIDSALEDPRQSISSIGILSASERKTILKEFNKSTISVDTYQPVPHILESKADDVPQQIAAIDEHTQISYRQLNSRANQLARYLTARDPKNGKLVGIYMNRTIDKLIAILAILKSGAAYVPIDPMFPKNRIGYMIGHSQIDTILTDRHVEHLLKQDVRNVISVDDIQQQLDTESSENLDREIPAESLAYVIYTSGSTGKPKGVEIPHGALSNFLSSMAAEPGMVANDNLLAVTTLSFDISMLELFLPMTVGAKVVIASRAESMDGSLLLKAIQNHQITMMQATPVTWRMLINAGWNKQTSFKALCGGEPLPSDLARMLLERSGEVWNMYGPTETTIWSTCHRLATGETPILVGKPIANTTTYVLDNHLNPVPIGVSGTLYIGGRGLSRGYLRNPEQTSTVFISAPPCFEDSGLIYNTGDLARFHKNGCLEILGRTDHQVKIRGFRIELGEIETQLSKYPATKECVVAAMEQESGDKALVAFYVLKEGEHVTIAQFREHLARTLPEYMIPGFFVQLEEMPLTPNGKTDRQALPLPDRRRPDLGHDYVPPKTDLETKTAVLWRKILNLDQIGIHDKFFEIGGDSLLAVQLLTELNASFDCDLSVLSLFQYPTIHTLVGHLRHDEVKDTAKNAPSKRAQQKRDALEELGRRRSRRS